MAFIAERISPADVETYGITAIDATVPGSSIYREWCIDRQRGIYFREIASGREEFRHESRWNFFWRGILLTVRLELLDASSNRGGPGWAHWKLVRINGDVRLPEVRAATPAEFIDDLRDALLCYKDGGIHATNTEFSVILDIDPGVRL